MMRVAKFLTLLAGSVLLQRAFVTPAVCADCIVECMERSGCWSGRSLDPSAHCGNQPELCRIQCQGKSNNVWGAIAYSTRDHAAGWTFDQSDKAAAERSAMQFCTKQGGVKCVVQTSFSNSCGAVAADGEIATWATSNTRVNAQQQALAQCSKAGGKKCEIEAWVCSGGSGGSGTPSAPPREGSWAAIAYSARDMGAGYSQGKADKASAEKEAMNLCAQRGKACVLETSFSKQCGALAADGLYTGLGTSTDQREAMQKAMDGCKKAGGARCVPHIMFCSM